MGCCGCFGFSFARKPKKVIRPNRGYGNNWSHEPLLQQEVEEVEDDGFDSGDIIDTGTEDDEVCHSPVKRSEEILMERAQNGLICREIPVKETHKVVRTEDEDGNKMVNEYVREQKIGSGSYGKVVLYRSCTDGKHYAIKAFHKSHLLKMRVAPSETAMGDVLREVSIMKMVCHPNIVNLIEVIDDPETDNFYMVLEYVEGKWVCEDTGPPSVLEENKARQYLRDIVTGLMYLHSHDDNDKLRRSPGTPVFTAPECCVGDRYHGKSADTWAVGVTLYCMILGKYPFLGETLQDTYDKIVNNPIILPDDMNPLLKNLLEGLLCKDPTQRLTLESVSQHEWFIGDEGPIPQYSCWCQRHKLQKDVQDGSAEDTPT
uniref:non-specific serine/threonine protein kinase n=1 Tax=Solanum tuberosum TaxID=4113 RepID=M1AEB7_SOLTU